MRYWARDLLACSPEFWAFQLYKGHELLVHGQAEDKPALSEGLLSSFSATSEYFLDVSCVSGPAPGTLNPVRRQLSHSHHALPWKPLDSA